jgi:hypothetical protein
MKNLHQSELSVQRDECLAPVLLWNRMNRCVSDCRERGLETKDYSSFKSQLVQWMGIFSAEISPNIFTIKKAI